MVLLDIQMQKEYKITTITKLNYQNSSNSSDNGHYFTLPRDSDSISILHFYLSLWQGRNQIYKKKYNHYKNNTWRIVQVVIGKWFDFPIPLHQTKL